MKCFPKDCKNCDYLKRYDMSIDDFTNICIVNGRQVDDCDSHFISLPCPLDINNKSKITIFFHSFYFKSTQFIL